ncbi:MAG: PilZ domain-containing protein [Nitrospirota bacterium]
MATKPEKCLIFGKALEMTKEQRAHVRFDLQQEIRYAILSREDGDLTGITLNISDGGLCMYIFISLSKGQKIIIERGLGDRAKKGEVRWIKQLGEDVYKVGLMFIQ